MKKVISFLFFSFLISFIFISYANETVNACGYKVFCDGGDGGGGGDATTNWTFDLSTGYNSRSGIFSEPFDTHRYTIVAPQSGHYDFTIKSTYDSGDYKIPFDAWLEDFNLNTMFNASETNYTKNDVYLSKGSTYFLSVQHTYSYDWGDYGSYTIDINVQDDNTLITAKSLDGVSSVSSQIDFSGDVDYYTFTAQEDGVWGYSVTGVYVDISIICNDKDIKYSNPLYSYYGSANYTLTNSSFFAFKEGGHYTIKVEGSNTGTYSINKYTDIGKQTIELNSEPFSTSVVYSYPGYIDGYQGYEIGYFTTKDKAKLFIDSLSPGVGTQTATYVIGLSLVPIKTLSPLGFYNEFATFMTNVEITHFIDYAKQQIDQMDSEGIYIALRLENGSVSHYQVTICPWDQKTYYYNYLYYYDYTTITDEY